MKRFAIAVIPVLMITACGGEPQTESSSTPSSQPSPDVKAVTCEQTSKEFLDNGFMDFSARCTNNSDRLIRPLIVDAILYKSEDGTADNLTKIGELSETFSSGIEPGQSVEFTRTFTETAKYNINTTFGLELIPQQ